MVAKFNLGKADRMEAVPAAKYQLKLVSVESGSGQKADYLRWQYEILKGKLKGRKVSKVTALNEEGLGRLASHMESHGIEIPSGDLTLAKIKNLIKPRIDDEGEAEVLIQTVNGNQYNDVVHWTAADAEDEDEDEDEDGDEEDEEEGEDLPDEDEINEMGLKDLKGLAKTLKDDHDIKVNLAKIKGLGKKRKALIKAVAEAQEAEEGDEDGDEEELDPVEKSRLLKMRRPGIADIIETYGLDIDPDDKAYKGNKGFKQLKEEVAELLEDEGLLED